VAKRHFGDSSVISAFVNHELTEWARQCRVDE
jgi:hypothetical protein